MARQNKIKSVKVYYPTKNNEEEFKKRVTKSMAKVLCKMYPPEVIDKVIERLEKRCKNMK